jgi:hypothetical protein
MEELDQNVPAAHWRAFYTHSDNGFYIDAPPQVLAASKNSLVSLLELAESLEASCVTMSVAKNRADFRTLVRTMSYLGFRLVAPLRGNDGLSVTLRYDIEE